MDNYGWSYVQHYIQTQFGRRSCFQLFVIATQAFIPLHYLLSTRFKSLCLLSFVQIKSPVVSGGVVGWGEWLGPGGHDVGNTDVLVSEEGNPPVPGKAATGQLKVRGNHKERLRRWDHESRCVGEYERKGQSQEWCQGQEWVDEGQRLASHVSDLRL